MPRSFQEIIRLIQNGDPVDSSINTILRAIAGNAEAVKLLLDESLLGQVVMAREVTVADTVKVGQAVYFNKTGQQFERALAMAYTDLTTGALVTADSTQAWGICYYKHNSTKADILLYGYTAVDMSDAIDGTDPGIYYLSSASAGKLVRQAPPVSVPMLFWDGTSNVFVNPNFSNAFLQHQHYKFELQPVTAGTHVVPSVGGHHTITPADDSIEGWLPADDASFNDKAPAGAKFGYNIAASALNNIWPPLPQDGASISWVRPTEEDSGSVDLPGDALIYEDYPESTTYSDGTTTTETRALPGSPSVTAGIIVISESLYTDLGLEIRNVRLDATDSVKFDVVNNTGADQDVAGTLRIEAYETVSYSVTDATNFKEDTVPNGLVVMDANGIWWMSDCYALVPWPVDYGTPPASVTTEGAILTAGLFGIARRSSTATNVLSVLYGEHGNQVNDIAIDPDNYNVYAAVVGTQKIVRVHSNEAQTAVAELWTASGSDTPFGIDVDLTNGHIYFTVQTANKLYRMDLDGGNVTQILSGLTAPRGLRLDVGNDFIYFIDGTKIRRCTLAGASVTDLVTGLTTPQFLALDVAASRIYWTDTGTSKIQRSTLAGASVTDILTSAVAVGIDLDITNSLIYFTTSTDLVRHCTLVGGSATTLDTLATLESLGGLRYEQLPAPTAELCGDLDMELTLWFTKMQFQTAETVVESLRAADDSGLIVRCIFDGDTTKTTGSLEIDFDPTFLVDTGDDESGSLVFKRYADKKFFRGPVVEAIVVDSDYVNATSTITNDDNHQGVVTLSFNPTPVGTELSVEMVRLSNAEEVMYQDTLGITFLEGIDAEFRAKVNVPATISADTVRIVLRFMVLARANGSLPTLTLTARTVPRPGVTTATSLTLPVVDTSVTLSVAAATSMVEDDYIELVSEEIETTPGAFVLYTLGRAGESDSFAGELHIIDQRAVVSSLA